MESPAEALINTVNTVGVMGKGPKIEAAFAALPDVTLYLFAPSGAPEPIRMRAGAKRPRMTDATAATVGILARYSQFD